MEVRVKKIPLNGRFMTEQEKNIITRFNESGQHINLRIHDGYDLDTLDDEAMYDYVATTPDGEEIVKILSELSLKASPVYISRDDIEMKRYNEDWHPVEHCSYGALSPLVNEKKNYTMLYQYPCSLLTRYVVAYNYCEEDNSWGQGYYFNDFYSALEFMFSTEN